MISSMIKGGYSTTITPKPTRPDQTKGLDTPVQISSHPNMIPNMRHQGTRNPCECELDPLTTRTTKVEAPLFLLEETVDCRHTVECQNPETSHNEVARTHFHPRAPATRHLDLERSEERRV